MSPLPHNGADAIGRLDPPDHPEWHEPVAFLLRFTFQLPVEAARAGLAFASFAANEIVHRQVVGAFEAAGQAKLQSAYLASLGHAVLPEGPLTLAADQAARMAAEVADAMTESAGSYGRAFGRKASILPSAEPRSA